LNDVSQSDLVTIRDRPTTASDTAAFPRFDDPDPVLMVLRLGRERIAKSNGWCQYQPIDPKGRFSTVGAVSIDTDLVIPVQNEAAAYLFAALPWWWRICKRRWHTKAQVADWYNDKPGRMQAEIVKLYECAIEARRRCR
jgi:hypothetical protein